MRWEWLGRAPYGETLARMRARRDEVIAGRAPDVLWLCEHGPVVTLGKGAAAGDVLATPEALAARGIELHRVERGGKATYHGPGQLVGYPIAHVGGGGVGVARFVARLGEAVAAWCRARGADARFDLRCTGVFCPGGKIAALGIHVRQGVAMHGFALNLDLDLDRASGPWGTIVPCGDATCAVTSLAAETGARAPSPSEAAPSLAEAVTRALPRSP